MKKVFKVSFIPSVGCFLYLNEKNLGQWMKDDNKSNDFCVRIEFGENFSQCTYSSVSTRANTLIDDDRVGINAHNAALIGISENEEVVVSRCQSPLLSSVIVRPKEDFQYDLIRKNNASLENNLLDQVQVVVAGSTIPIYLYSNVIIHLKIVKLEPKSLYGRLQQGTDLIIINPSEAQDTIDDEVNKPQEESNDESDGTASKTVFMKIFNKIFQDGSKNTMSSVYRDSPSKQLFKNHLAKLIRHFQGSRADSDENGNEIYLSEMLEKEKSSTFRIGPSFAAPSNVKDIISRRCIFASNFPGSKSIDGPCSFKTFCRITKGEECAKADSGLPEFGNLNLDYVYAYVVSFSDDRDESSDIIYVPDFVMNLLRLNVGSVVRVEEVKPTENLMIESYSFQSFGMASVITDPVFTEGLENIFKSLVRTVLDNIRLSQKVNTLIIGGTGTGKTHLLNSLGKSFESQFLFNLKIDCKALRRVKISHLNQIFTEKLIECCKRQPSVLMIDDLDALTIEDDEANLYNGMYSARIGNLITRLLSSCQRLNDISFIATGSSLSRFGNLSTDRGPIIFENIHEICELTADERSFMLRHLISLRNPWSHIDDSLVNYVSDNTKGYNVQDLVDLIEIAELKCLSKTDPETKGISKDNFESALAEKVPLSLHGVNLQKNLLTKWEDVGGMEESKILLEEMFAWPSRYQKLYKSCPLRLQCGVLLYGAPGTGKTLIAGAVANKFGLNFISIKGPEVFSKYVGASEQGIRDLFSRARRAKPCLLFFDEFDSLAPRRGSSNEDVNDRVVNQLLTELDGVEELTGVYILAATSRPDLLDPALLRPGRIDKAVHCQLPTKAERLSILKALSKNVRFAEDVDLEQVASLTDGYSGADLQAILYAAQTTLVKEIEKEKNGERERKLNQGHLKTALAQTKPSISKDDKVRYQSIFDTFIASRTGPLRSQPPEMQRKLMFA